MKDMRNLSRILTILTVTALSAGAGLAADAKAGQAAYDKSCKSCHGADGTPNAGMAKALKVEMKDLKSPEIQSKSDADFKKVITDGQGKMRPIASVTGASVDDVIAYVHSLKK
jgi:mono/diheme cytochrome c family protein